MARQYKGPYLYLRRYKDRPHQWMIRDRDKQIAIGATVDQRHDAENALRDYLDGKYQSERPVVGGRVRRFSNRMEGFIYFITCEAEGFPIKIGFATNLNKRVAGLQVALPYPIKILATIRGTMEIESDLHTGFGHIRLHREWFRRDQELLDYIEKVAATEMREQTVEIRGKRDAETQIYP